VRYNDLWPHGEDIPFYSDFNIGHFVEPWIKTEADLECLKHIIRLHETQEVLDQARAGFASGKRLADKYGLATVAHVGAGLTGAMHLFGASELCLMTVENPGLVDACLEHEHRINLRTMEFLGELGADSIRRNGFYETADFYGPATLERFLGPRLRREAKTVREAGMLTSYTIHTGVMPILDYLATLTMDSLFGIDIAFKGMDLAALRDKLAPTTSFWIGPSSTFHLWNGPEATRQAVRKVFDTFGKLGLILAPCVSSHSIMPWESTLAMIDEWKRLRTSALRQAQGGERGRTASSVEP
jgi:uroporphyrinogen-III decarboxylase